MASLEPRCFISLAFTSLALGDWGMADTFQDGKDGDWQQKGE